MLRSSIVQSRRLLSLPVHQRTGAQWLSRAGVSRQLSGQRFFADHKSPTSDSPSPASPSSESPVRPESATPSPSNEGPAHSSNPPPTPPRKTGRFRRFLLYLILTSGLVYGGGIFLALKSDQFHDFFTEYFPYGEDCVLYFEERDFYRRFPNAVGKREPSPPKDSERVTIPGRSGISWKIAEEEKSENDALRKGPHMSAVKDANEDVANAAQAKPEKASPEEKTAAIFKAKKDKTAENQGKAAKSDPKVEPKEEPRKPAVSPVSTLDLTQVQEGDDPMVQELVNVFNGLITAIGADDKAGNYSGPISNAKEELQKVGEKIVAIRTEARNGAQQEINQIHGTFDESARELIRRFEEVRASDAAQFREEYEAERETLVRSYQEKVNTELARAEELAEQRLRNELVEQAIELNRKYVHNVQDLVERERGGRLGKLNELTADVGELEELLTAWQDVINTNLKTQQLQVAVDSVRTVLERSDMPRPFIRELVAVKELAAEDPVVEAAVASINPTAYQRGIPSTSQLIDRFRRVAGEVRKASLLPENAGIASHAASVVLSKVMFKKDGLATGDHVESVLTRTESLLEEGNLDDAAREMNTLHGWAKILSKDWLADVRRVLEVKQALEVIEAEARLQCLRVE